MEIPAAKGFSIWLMFEKNDEEFFQRIINQFSTELNSPIFIPHITLFAGLEGDELELLEKFDCLSQFNSFNVKCKKVFYSNEFYRSVFVEVEKDETLKNFFDSTSTTFNVNSDFEKFFPHISLLYSFEKEEVKTKLINKYLQNYPEKIRVERVGLCKTRGRPYEWELIKIIELKNFKS